MSPDTSPAAPETARRTEPSSAERHLAEAASRRGVLLATALLPFAAVAAPAAAQVPDPPKIPIVEQPIADPGGGPSIGNGVTAWIRTADGPAGEDATFEIRTMRGGVPTLAATVPNRLPGEDEALREGALEIEVGTTADRVPVAVLRTPGSVKQGRRALDRTYLVRLDTGARRRLPSKIDGLPVYGTAIDNGRLYFTVGRERPKATSTSSLWRASVTAGRTGTPRKIRTSRRDSVWFQPLADRGHIAIEANEPTEGAYFLNTYVFGTPRGTWNRAGGIAVYDGPIPQHDVAGFTKDGALVTFLTSDDPRDPTFVTRTPTRKGGRKTTVGIGTDAEHTTITGAFDPETGRILTSGFDPEDPFGYSGVAFPPPAD